jgi:hypothetical protein
MSAADYGEIDAQVPAPPFRRVRSNWSQAVAGLYLSVLGPNSDGKVTHAVNVYVPKQFELVEMKAWTGETETACNSRVERTRGIRPAEEVGCLVLRLPEKATATTTTDEGSAGK